MPLEVDFKIPKRELLYQENPACSLVLKNTDNAMLQVHHPAFNPNSPALRVTEIETGVEVVHRKLGHFNGDVYSPMKPGEEYTHEFALFESFEAPLPPGEYEISAIVLSHDGARTVETRRKGIKILPVTPKSLSTAFGCGGWSAVRYGVSLNVVGEKARIVRHTFKFTPGGGVVDAAAGPEADLHCDPIPSEPGNQTIAGAHWIAWLEDGDLCVTHMDTKLGCTPVQRLSIGGLQAEIVPNLHTIAPPASAERPAGIALLWLGSPNSSGSKLQVIKLSPLADPSLGEHIPLKSGRPDWMRTIERTDGSRLFLYVDRDGEKLALRAIRWPGQIQRDKPPAPLAEWTGNCLGGDVVMSPEDTVVGATLVATPNDKVPSMEMKVWSLDKKGVFLAAESRPIKWDFSLRPVRAIVRANPHGPVGALIRDETGRWLLYDGRERVEPAFGAYAGTKLPLDLAYLGTDDLVYIAARPYLGYDALLTDGRPIPEGDRGF